MSHTPLMMSMCVYGGGGKGCFHKYLHVLLATRLQLFAFLLLDRNGKRDLPVSLILHTKAQG